MLQTLKQYIEDSTVTLSGGKKVSIIDAVSSHEGLYLQYLVTNIKPKTSIEVGLGSGISSLFILEEMKRNRGKKLIGMDPSQFDSHKDTTTKNHGELYKGNGLYLIKKNGLSKMYKFYNKTSQQVLPVLFDEGVRVQFAFIDGWHTFDHTLVDFFYVDQILEKGGIVAVHDITFPAIKLLSNFIETNRNYKKLKIPAKFKTDNIVAFKKISKDTRSWDHFVPFHNTDGLLDTIKKIPSLTLSAIKRRLKNR